MITDRRSGRTAQGRSFTAVVTAAAWLSLLVGPLTRADAQPRVVIPGGILRGTVTDTVLRAGLSYALVTAVGADRQVFANERGGFVIAGLKPGLERVRVQQIGYAPAEISVLLAEPARDSASEELVIALGAKVQVLPELNVTAGAGFRTYRQPKQCVAPPNVETGANAQMVIDQAVTNADRILALERGYPFIVTFEHVREAYDVEDRVLARWVDTIGLNPAHRAGYRKGRVLSQPRRGSAVEALYFTMGDLARDEFQQAHCVWYGGLDSSETGRVHRIDFEPAPGVKTPDWAGSLHFDWDSFQLVRSDARLVRVNPRRSAIRGARCVARYGGDIPTIVHEQVALCLTDTGGKVAASSRDTYRAIATRFLGLRPGDVR